MRDCTRARHREPAGRSRVGRVQRRPAVGPRPRRDHLGAGARRACAPLPRRGPDAHAASSPAAGAPHGARDRSSRDRGRRMGPPRPAQRPARRSSGHLTPTAGSPPTDLGSTYIKLGQIISSGEGLFPEELVERVQAVPRPGARRDASTVVQDGRRGGPRHRPLSPCSSRSTPRRSPRRRSPRCTPRRCTRASGRREGAATPGRDSSSARTCG